MQEGGVALSQMQEGEVAPGEVRIYLLELLMRRGGCLFGSWETKMVEWLTCSLEETKMDFE